MVAGGQLPGLIGGPVACRMAHEAGGQPSPSHEAQLSAGGPHQAFLHRVCSPPVTGVWEQPQALSAPLPDLWILAEAHLQEELKQSS